MSATMLRFYKGIADHTYPEEPGTPDYQWVLDRMEDEDHPRLGPPLPPSIFDKMLREVYAPHVAAHIANSNPIMRYIRAADDHDEHVRLHWSVRRTPDDYHEWDDGVKGGEG